jgi:hypothetical protein
MNTTARSRLTLYTKMKNVDDMKELCNMNIQEGTKNRLLLPIGSTMLPYHPTHEDPPEIHEKLIVKHNRHLESLSQGSIKGLSWIQAEAKLRVIPTYKFAAAYPSITSISAVELLGMVHLLLSGAEVLALDVNQLLVGYAGDLQWERHCGVYVDHVLVVGFFFCCASSAGCSSKV